MTHKLLDNKKAPLKSCFDTHTEIVQDFVQLSHWFVSQCVSGAVVHSCVSRLQILPSQSHCVTGGVSGDAELVFQFITMVFLTIIIYSIYPLEGFPCCLTNPCCSIVAAICNRCPSQFAGDCQRLSWLYSHDTGLGVFKSTIYPCKTSHSFKHLNTYNPYKYKKLKFLLNKSVTSNTNEMKYKNLC